MVKTSLQRLLNTTENAEAAQAKALAKGKPTAAAEVPKVRQIHKEGEVNISAYFPFEVKASLRMVQAKTGNNVKECLGEALHDLFRKHNVAVTLELGEGQ